MLLPAPAILAAGLPSERKTREEKEKQKEKEGGVPFTASASVPRGTVVTGWLTIRVQVTGCGESVPTEGRAHHEDALFGSNHIISYTVWFLVKTFE